jgi:Uma2 family endonuclease
MAKFTVRAGYHNGMSIATLLSVEEYLAASYRPDCDYVDGVLMERNLGQKDHSNLQGLIYSWFRERRRALRLKAFTEMRLQVAKRRFRIPDVCVVQLPEPDEQIFTTPPYICIEVLSPDDTFPKLQDRLDDYLSMGVPNVWVLDPGSHRAWRIVREGHLEVLDGFLRTHDLEVVLPLEDLFTPDA